MSNTAQDGGLRLVDAVNGAGSGEEIVVIPTSDVNTMGIGDPVNQAAGNYSSIGSGPNVPAVVQGTTTGVVYGVVMSYLPHWTDGTGTMNLSQVYRTASTAEYALIRVANNQDVYEITDDGVTAGLTSGHLSYNYKFVANGASTTSGLSKFTIDSANGATTATYPMKVIGPSYNPAYGDPTVASCSWRVNLNNVVRSGGTGVLGV